MGLLFKLMKHEGNSLFIIFYNGIEVLCSVNCFWTLGRWKGKKSTWDGAGGAHLIRTREVEESTKPKNTALRSRLRVSWHQRDQSLPPKGHIWCTSCNVIVQNSVSGVSSHSASTHHTSNSRKPLSVSTSSAPFVASEQASAILPPLKSIYNRSSAQDDAIEVGQTKRSRYAVALFLPPCSLSYFVSSTFLSLNSQILNWLRRIVATTLQQTMN